MSDIIKQESVKLIFSLLFFTIVLIIGYLALPKMMEKAGKRQAAGYWKAEREANERRLFGGEDT